MDSLALFSFRDILLLTSDVDEIPRSRFLHLLKSCGIPRQFPPIVLQCATYYYSFEFRSSSAPAVFGTTLSRFNARQMIPSGIRNARFHYRPIRNVCFHCSYCFDTVTLVRLKLSSFSHTKFDLARYHNRRSTNTVYVHVKSIIDDQCWLSRCQPFGNNCQIDFSLSLPFIK